MRFTRQYGRAPADLEDDLRAMHEMLFNPVAREERLRRALSGLAQNDRSGPPPAHIPEVLLLPTPTGLWLVTPEGRAAMAVLERSLRECVEDPCFVDEVDIHAAEHLLLDITREWSRHRLNRTLKLQAGGGGRMLPVAMAIPLLLLQNGNIGFGRAMRQPKGLAEQQSLDEALATPVRRFAEALSGDGGEFDDRHLALYNGYALSEARRRLGDDLRLDRIEADSGQQHHPRKALYIAAGREDAVLAFLGRELRARGVSPEASGSAFDALVKAYGTIRPALSAFGVAYEDPARTPIIRQRLINAMEES